MRVGSMVGCGAGKRCIKMQSLGRESDSVHRQAGPPRFLFLIYPVSGEAGGRDCRADGEPRFCASEGSGAGGEQAWVTGTACTTLISWENADPHFLLRRS